MGQLPSACAAIEHRRTSASVVAQGVHERFADDALVYGVQPIRAGRTVGAFTPLEPQVHPNPRAASHCATFMISFTAWHSVPLSIPCDGMTITADQVKQARDLLGWSQLDLAWEAEIALNSVYILEETKRHASAKAVAKIQSTLKSAGVIFLEENREGSGVTLRELPR